MLDYISDWPARLRSRLYAQFKDSVSFTAFANLLGALAQDWEDAAQSCLTIISIDNSSGVQLNNIGKLVGQPRIVADDATYRTLLKARILANKSEGTPEELYGVLNALLSRPGLLYVLGGQKEFVVRVIGVITSAAASLARDLLGVAKEAGARAIIEWQQVPTANLFMFDTGPGFDVGVWADARKA
jgi:hypothetical protein